VAAGGETTVGEAAAGGETVVDEAGVDEVEEDEKAADAGALDEVWGAGVV
jgi:hypothetical protein